MLRETLTRPDAKYVVGIPTKKRCALLRGRYPTYSLIRLSSQRIGSYAPVEGQTQQTQAIRRECYCQWGSAETKVVDWTVKL